MILCVHTDMFFFCRLQKPGTVSPFHKAIERADDESIQLLIDHGIEVQCHDLQFALARENEYANCAIIMST